MPAQLGYMATDQYGEFFHIGKHPPRQWLLDHFGRKHSDKMYCDTKDGRTRHEGYIIAGHWLTIFRVCEWKEAS